MSEPDSTFDEFDKLEHYLNETFPRILYQVIVICSLDYSNAVLSS